MYPFVNETLTSGAPIASTPEFVKEFNSCESVNGTRYVLSKVILFGERSLRRALSEYVEHFLAERNHQGKGNVLLFPRGTNISRDGPVQCRERLGGLLCFYRCSSNALTLRRASF
jgi:hypothetical protein